MKKEIVSKLRNCLTVIILEAEMVLHKEKLSKTGRESIEKIKDKGWEIDKTIEKLIVEVIDQIESEVI